MAKRRKAISRREFLRLAALTASGTAIAATGLQAAPALAQTGTPPPTAGTPVPSPTGGASPTPSASATPTLVPKVGGTLTIGGTNAGPPQLDPHVVTFAAERLYFPGLYNGLTEYTPDMEPVPALAEKWEASDDLKTYTFYLRKGVKFHNGRELEAEDVKWSFERCLDPKLGSQLRQNVQEVEKIEVVDKYTVKMTLSAASAVLPHGAQELKIIPKEALETFNKNPVGTGPYMFEDFVPSEKLVLKRNDNYWGGKPALDKVVITQIPDATAAVAALTTGTWDVMYSAPLKDAATFKGDPKVQPLVPNFSSSNVFWELDVTSPPFDKVEARQALSYATDRKSIAEVAYFGFATPSVTNNFMAENHWAFNPNLTHYDYDLDKAKALFEKAGMKEGTELTWWTLAGQFPEWVTAGEILAQSLAEIGITLKIEQHDIGAWVDKFYPSGKTFPGLVIPNGDSAAADPAFPLKFFASKRCECNYNDPNLDALLAQGKTTADKEKRKAAYQEIQKIVNEQIPVIIPCTWPLISGTQKYVESIWAESGGQIHYETAWLNK